MKTRVKDMVKSILEELENLSDTDESDDILVSIESQLAADTLNVFLDKYAGSENEASLQNLKPFLDLVSERWRNIKNTDAIYNHRPNTYANRAYFILAKSLSTMLKSSIYDILMPTVTALDFQTSSNLCSVEPKEFVLSDSGVPIGVVKCLDEAEKNKTNQLRCTDHSKRILNEQEQGRVIHHSDLTSRYYQAITCYANLNSQDPDLLIQIQKKLRQAKIELVHAISQPAYKVRASYQKEGKKRLLKYLLTNVKTKQDLINIMLRYMPQNKWMIFLNEISDEDLSRIILEDDSLINVLQRKSNYKEDQTHNKAMLLCLTEVYWRYRSKGDEASLFTRVMDRYVPTWITQQRKRLIGGCNIKEKESGVKWLRNQLMSHAELGQLDRDVKLNGADDEINALINDRTSILAMIAEQAKLVSDPAYFNVNQVSRSWRIWG